jgi:hypothetical protein
MAEEERARPTSVLVYGGDHSPWVQAVLLGLFERNIPHTVVTIPPLAVFRNSGILMPAASIDGRPWMLQSEDILCELGFQKVSEEDMLALFGTLRGGHHRVDSRWRFWVEWSFVRDHHPRRLMRLRNHFLRAFSVLYFQRALKEIAARTKPGTPEAFRRRYSYWEQKLKESPGPFIEGDSPGTQDFMLFGVVQCHASIRVPPIPVLHSDPALPNVRTWIRAMQERFRDYEHLYSGVYFEPRTAPPHPATVLDRLAYWLGAAFIWIAAPVTIPLAGYYQKRVRRRGMLRLPAPRPRPGTK